MDSGYRGDHGGDELAEFAAPPVALRLSARLQQQVIAHLEAQIPQEGVGLLAVDGISPREPAVAVAFFPGTNIDASPTRYTMDPAEVIAALQEIERHGWRLGAIVHSHPVTAAVPSETDLREAHYPESLLVIVTWTDGRPGMRAWQILPVVAPAPAPYVEVPIILEGGEEHC